MISAALDSELPPAGLVALRLHLEACETCSSWQSRAQGLARSARLGAAEAVPGPDQTWKRAVIATAPHRRTSDRGLRITLVAIASAQLAVTLPFLLFGHADAIRDQGALDVALAVGLLVVAWSPSRAAGLQTFLGVAALLLISMELIDLIRGRGELLDLGRHFLVLASWCVVRSLARVTPPAPATSHGTPFRDLRQRPWPVFLRSAPADHGWTAPPALPDFGERQDRRAA
jgi:predicted anti-sigma-YlaC factor YlaD